MVKLDPFMVFGRGSSERRPVPPSPAAAARIRGAVRAGTLHRLGVVRATFGPLPKPVLVSTPSLLGTMGPTAKEF